MLSGSNGAAVENGQGKSSKKPKAGFLTTAWNLFAEWTSVTTVHGVRYLGEKNLHLIERFFWIIVLIISTSTSFYMIFQLFDKWQNTPVIVSFNERPKPTWQIPFPAVTICPETKSYKKLLNFTDIYNKVRKNQSLENIPIETMKNFEAMAQYCETDLFSEKNFIMPDNKLDTNEIEDRLLSFSLNKTDTFDKCSVMRQEMEECEDFRQQITADGVCYTFNMLGVNRIYNERGMAMLDESKEPIDEEPIAWNIDDGYLTDSLFVSPLRVPGSGVAAGLKINLKLDDEDIDYVCRGASQGFKILLHPPNELPNVKSRYFRVPLKQNVMVNVKPKMMETSEGLRSYKPDQRQCFFNHESKLDFFEIYTKTNCEIECATKFTLVMCDCVHVSMPRINGTRVCGLKDISCMRQAMQTQIMFEMGANLGDLEEFREHFPKCKCLSSCTSINYEAEVTQDNFEFRKVQRAFEEVVEADSRTDGFKGETFSQVTIFFDDDEIISSKRSELYGIVDFIANCGGLLGLFMGVSVLSIVEIFYYCSLRPYYNTNYDREQTAGASGDDAEELQKLNDAAKAAE